MSEITFIGLGAMGSAIARVLLENQCDITVWNRTEGKADKLVSLGAKKAQTISEAIDASPRIFICIDSYSSTSKLLEEEGVKLLLQGKAIVQMSTGTPSEAKEAETWLEKHGGNFLATTIMGLPSSIGKPEAQFLVAGHDKIFQDCEHYLKFLGHDIRYLGSNIGAAAALNLAIIGRFVAKSGYLFSLFSGLSPAFTLPNLI